MTTVSKETQQLLESSRAAIVARTAQDVHIPVAVSARHVHLSDDAVEALFGKGYHLTKMRDLSQPEGWAAEETVEVIGPKGSLAHVRVLGPTRSQTQIEVSKTDTFSLGLDAPVRPSGMLEDTPSVTLKGPAGTLETDGLIIAARHIHMHPSDAERLGLEDGDYVDVSLGEKGRRVSLNNVLIRIKPSFVTEMHIDTDEANAAGIKTRTEGELVRESFSDNAELIGRRSMDLGKASLIEKENVA